MKLWNYYHRQILAVVAILVTVALLVPGVLAQERVGILCEAIPFDNCVDARNGSDITMYSDGGSTQTFKVEGTTGTITLANGETIANTTDGLISFGGGFIRSSTTITVTDGQTITPTVYSGYRLNAAGAVTVTLAACSSDFQPLYLYGEDAQTITIADSNIRTGDGDVVDFDQYDVVVWECVNSEWNLINEANNQ